MGGKFQSGSPKSQKGVRTITLPEFVSERLETHISLFPSKDGLVFSAAEGGPLRKTWLRRHFKPAVERAELAPFRWQRSATHVGEPSRSLSGRIPG